MSFRIHARFGRCCFAFWFLLMLICRLTFEMTCFLKHGSVRPYFLFIILKSPANLRTRLIWCTLLDCRGNLVQIEPCPRLLNWICVCCHRRRRQAHQSILNRRLPTPWRGIRRCGYFNWTNCSCMYLHLIMKSKASAVYGEWYWAHVCTQFALTCRRCVLVCVTGFISGCWFWSNLIG